MKRCILMIAIALATLHPLDCRAQGGKDQERILEVANRIEEAYGKLQSYACDIEGMPVGKKINRSTLSEPLTIPSASKMLAPAPSPRGRLSSIS